MTDEINPPRSIEQKLPEPMPRKKNNRWIFFIFLLLLFSLVTALWLGYKELHKTYRLLALKSKEESHTIAHLRLSILQLTDNLKEVRALVTQASSDKGQKNVSSPLQKWRIAQAKYLIQMAQYELQFRGNLLSAITALTQADELLMAKDEPFDAIHPLLMEEVKKLQTAATQENIQVLYLKLSDLNKLIDQIPLQLPVLKTPAIIPSETSESLWKKAWTNVKNALKDFVIIQRTSDVNRLVLPQERMLLLQILHAQAEQVMNAVLTRDDNVYHRVLSRMQSLIQRHFSGEPQALATLAYLNQLQAISIAIAPHSLTHVLVLLDRYLTSAKEN